MALANATRELQTQIRFVEVIPEQAGSDAAQAVVDDLNAELGRTGGDVITLDLRGDGQAVAELFDIMEMYKWDANSFTNPGGFNFDVWPEMYSFNPLFRVSDPVVGADPLNPGRYRMNAPLYSTQYQVDKMKNNGYAATPDKLEDCDVKIDSRLRTDKAFKAYWKIAIKDSRLDYEATHDIQGRSGFPTFPGGGAAHGDFLDPGANVHTPGFLDIGRKTLYGKLGGGGKQSYVPMVSHALCRGQDFPDTSKYKFKIKKMTYSVTVNSNSHDWGDIFRDAELNRSGFQSGFESVVEVDKDFP